MFLLPDGNQAATRLSRGGLVTVVMHDLLVHLLCLLAQLFIASRQPQQGLGAYLARSRGVGCNLLVDSHRRFQIAIDVFLLDPGFEANSRSCGARSLSDGKPNGDGWRKDK